MAKVIGITGTFLAGSGTAARLLSEMIGAPVASYSGKLGEMVAQKGLPIQRVSFHSVGNELRSRDPEGLSKLIIADFGKARGKKFFVAEKLRSMGDYNGLKRRYGKNFILLAIDAPAMARYKRSLARRRGGEENASFGQFVESELKENKPGASEGEMNISALMQLADYLIVNEGSEQELERKLREFSKKFGLMG